MEEGRRHQAIRIDVLPDDVLLEILDFYMVPSLGYDKTAIEAWQTLVHVCQRWRYLVLGSPRRLNLRLFCTSKTPIRDTLNVWPALPLVVECEDMGFISDTDNVIAALEQSNRVCQVTLTNVADWQVGEVSAAMQVPFPEMTQVELSSEEESPVIPDSFLGGSAPRLRRFFLDGIPFPGVRNLLSSATHLVDLHLSDIPYSGYVSAEAMIAIISALSNLETLCLRFRSPESRPVSESRNLSRIKRSILPTLRRLFFGGVTEYLEELVTHIDAPQLDHMDITLFSQIGTPLLAQFINRTSLKAGDKVRMEFCNGLTIVELLPRPRNLHIMIFGAESDLKLSSVAQFCKPLHALSTVESLYIERQFLQLVWMGDAIENNLWFQLLLPFTAVKNLYLSQISVPSIAAALQELAGGRITEVLPGLQHIFVEGLEPSGPLQEIIGQFIAARQLSGHPIAISVWDRERQWM